IRRVEPDVIPARLALEGLGDALLEIVPLEPELRRVVLWGPAMINAVDNELPGSAAIDCGLDGDAVTNLPAKALGRAGAHDCPLAVLEKGVPLVIRHDQFGDYLALVFRVDHELREEVLLVLVDAAEPVVMGHRLNARNA